MTFKEKISHHVTTGLPAGLDSAESNFNAGNPACSTKSRASKLLPISRASKQKE